MNEDCAFCIERKSGTAPAFISEKIGTSSRVLCESANYYAVPSVSPLAVGHVMIIPKQHYKSMAQCEAGTLPELVSLTGQVKDILERVFHLPPLLFEHGIGRDEAGGCGISHAHLHMVPLGKWQCAQALEAVAGYYRLGASSELSAALLRVSPCHSYLLIGARLSSMYVINPADVTSQYIRKIVSEVTGAGSWNWKEFFGWDDFTETFNKLQAYPLAFCKGT